MGGDGGQVIDRATMVRTKGWGLTKSAGGNYANSLGEMANYVQMVSEDTGMTVLERHQFRMTTCRLTQEPLREPVVACRLGNLYNKEAFVSALLNKTIPANLGHVNGLKDVKTCVLTWATEGKDSASSKERRMVCPVTREDLDAGGSRAVLIWTSGAVVSAKALKELKMKECPVTGKAFDPDKDVIPMAPEGEELQKLREKLPASATKKRKASAESAGADPAAPQAAAVPGDMKVKAEVPGAKAEGEKRQKIAEKVAKSGVLESLLRKPGEGWRDKRDPFGTPAYNRGAHL